MSVLLLGTLLVGMLGAFFVSKIGTLHARHRLTAMNIIREYLELEIRAGYDGGNANTVCLYYETMTQGPSVSVLIDDFGTVDTADDLWGTLQVNPAPSYNTQNQDGSLLKQGTRIYKIAGFVLSWNENIGPVGVPLRPESAVTYIAQHTGGEGT